MAALNPDTRSIHRDALITSPITSPIFREGIALLPALGDLLVLPNLHGCPTLAIIDDPD